MTIEVGYSRIIRMLLRIRLLCRRAAFLRGRRCCRRRNRDVRPERVQLLLADSSDGEQILDAPKSAALLPHVNDPLCGNLTHTRQLL